jgi:hypothetical protein
MLTILAAWACLSLLVGIFFAAVCRGGLAEEDSLGHLPARTGTLTFLSGRRGAAASSTDPRPARVSGGAFPLAGSGRVGGRSRNDG